MANLYIDPLTGRLVYPPDQRAQPGVPALQPIPFGPFGGASQPVRVGDSQIDLPARTAQAGPAQGVPAPAPTPPQPGLIGPAMTGGTDLDPVRPPLRDADYAPRPQLVGPATTGGTEMSPPPWMAQPVEHPVPTQVARPEALPLPPPFVPPPDVAAAPPGAPTGAPTAAVPAAPQGAQPGILSGVQPAAAQRPQGSAWEDFAARLRPAEGTWTSVNSGGYAGAYQFGAPRLAELGLYSPGEGESLDGWGGQGGGRRSQNAWSGRFNIPGFPEVRTLQDFLRNPDAQNAAFQLHVADIDRVIDSTPGAEAFSRDGLRAVAHLGGPGGLRRFVETGGQHNPGDANGTTLMSYYTRFAGSDAPPGLSGVRGGTAPQSAQQGTRPPPLPSDAAFPPADTQALVRGSPSVFGIPGASLISAGAGMLAGRNPQEGLARAGQAFVSQGNVERQLANQDRTARNNEAYRRAVLNSRLQGRDALTPFSRVGTFRGSDGQLYERVMNRSTGQFEWRDQSGRPATNVPEQMTRVQDTGEGRVAGESAEANVQAGDSLINQATNAAPQIANIQRIRQLVQRERATGPDAATAIQRWAVNALGLPIGAITPQGVSLTEQQIAEFVSTRLPELVRDLRPVSNIDADGVRRALLTMRTQPDAVLALLDIFEPALRRQERLGREFAALPEAARAAIMRTPQGVSSWVLSRRQVYDAEGFAMNPTLQATEGAPPPAEQNPPQVWRTAPPQSERVVGRVYQTPRGPMRWTGQGWEPANE